MVVDLEAKIEAHAAVAMTDVEVAAEVEHLEKAIGFARVAPTRTLRGEMNAIAARNQRLTVAVAQGDIVAAAAVVADSEEEIVDLAVDAMEAAEEGVDIAEVVVIAVEIDVTLAAAAETATSHIRALTKTP